MITDTLKQAAKALQDTKPELAAALEAMAEQKPVGWRPQYGHGIESDFSKGLPPKETIDYWKVRGIDIEYAYAAPVATPEHDAQARSAILREAAEIAANHPSKDARAFASSVVHHFSDEHDSQVRNAALEACDQLHEHEDVQAPVGNSAWGEAYQEGWIAGTDAYREAIRALKTTGGAA